jgi:hypothetical protein
MKFETSVTRVKKEDTDRSESGKIRAPKWSTYRSFAAVEKAVFVLIVSAICVYSARCFYCNDG